MKGYDAADGYISRAFDPSTTDSHIVSVVKAAGAVVIVSIFPKVFVFYQRTTVCAEEHSQRDLVAIPTDQRDQNAASWNTGRDES